MWRRFDVFWTSPPHLVVQVIFKQLKCDLVYIYSIEFISTVPIANFPVYFVFYEIRFFERQTNG